LAPPQKASKEDSSVKPWTGIAEFCLESEKELQGMAGYFLPRDAALIRSLA
jgi:hypothetical protein